MKSKSPPSCHVLQTGGFVYPRYHSRTVLLCSIILAYKIFLPKPAMVQCKIHAQRRRRLAYEKGRMLVLSPVGV